jgi:Cation transporter/ATPase, N-terminus
MVNAVSTRTSDAVATPETNSPPTLDFAWHAVTPAAAFDELRANVGGLSEAEAAQRLETYRPNRLPERFRLGEPSRADQMREMVPSDKSNRATIEVRVQDIGQLFNSLDPSPFHERDLDDDAEAYIVDWAREVDTGGPFLIIVHLPGSELGNAEQRGLSSAIAHYFNYRTGTRERDLRDLLRTGRRSLSMGLAVLAVCVFIAQLLREMVPESAVAQALAEGLTIFGWVANWRPAEIFLYDVWAARRRIDLYRRIAQADVELRAFPAS